MKRRDGARQCSGFGQLWCGLLRPLGRRPQGRWLGDPARCGSVWGRAAARAVADGLLHPPGDRLLGVGSGF